VGQAKRSPTKGSRDTACGENEMMVGLRFACPTLPSIRREEAAVGAAGADAERDRAAAFGTVPFVGRLALVDVNSRVDSAASELHANEAAACAVPLRRLAVADRAIKMFAGHVDSLSDRG
jgi:hypothetical protein